MTSGVLPRVEWVRWVNGVLGWGVDSESGGDWSCLVARHCWSMAWLGFSACIPFNVSQLISRFHVDTDLTV